MGGTYSMSYTPSTGDTITAARWITANSEHIAGNDFAGLGDYSANATEMQSTADPYPGGAESLPTDGEGELERLRYQIKTQFGLSQWYHDATTPYETFLTNVSNYRRPNLVWVSVTTIDVENNTGTEHQTKILFPDGTSRSVTEDTGSTHKYRRFIITAAAEFTSGTEDSGLRSGITEAVSTWYAMYAVKSTIDSTKFVLAGDTTFPSQATASTLNTRYGTNGWVYLGTFRNGDGGSSTGDILAFTQAGPMTNFTNTGTGFNSGTVAPGLLLATNAAATTVTYTYSSGSGATDIPSPISHAKWIASIGASGTTIAAIFRDAGGAYDHGRFYTENVRVTYSWFDAAAKGARTTISTADTPGCDISIGGFFDEILAAGTSPLI
jgi:hypothetical protein